MKASFNPGASPLINDNEEDKESTDPKHENRTQTIMAWQSGKLEAIKQARVEKILRKKISDPWT